MYEDLSKEIERVLAMAGGIENAVRTREADLSRLVGELAALDGRTCTGREWWRDKDHPTRVAKLYALHSIDQTCPLHGTPSPGERLRVYVGSDPDRIAEARAAMEREARRQGLEVELAATRRGLQNCGHALWRFYDYLDYKVGDDGQPERRG